MSIKYYIKVKQPELSLYLGSVRKREQPEEIGANFQKTYLETGLDEEVQMSRVY